MPLNYFRIGTPVLKNNVHGRIRPVMATTHPSLAITKYWGKSDMAENLPATPSLALGLGNLETCTQVSLIPMSSREDSATDRIFINDVLQNPQRFRSFFDRLRSIAKAQGTEPFKIEARSTSNFPHSAGIASSSSGFAALALACTEALNLKISQDEISALARIGSASAARSVFGGFTLLPAGADHARQIHDEHWWPDLRIVIIQTEAGTKSISSRHAMEQCRKESPFYQAWVHDASSITEAALNALNNRNLRKLGTLARRSYLRMFATMLSADTPIQYWQPRSLEVLKVIDLLRAQGREYWETMDAGPQVKVFCLQDAVPLLLERLENNVPGLINITVSKVAGPPEVKSL